MCGSGAALSGRGAKTGACAGEAIGSSAMPSRVSTMRRRGCAWPIFGSQARSKSAPMRNSTSAPASAAICCGDGS